eukprot:CAMPEP_0170454234 /NCGR_PEP_ID=MMETSP0123-20130129/2558_1 /TAXON_ID=182087 /ORGANISM="Favella ehrenbergii, Strain Fehren 1" /LENGTH=81 /DNA_ID=CAMNT_0010716887 /DNA_START=454 /DNA_END=699 /DNA_ORIENTATION=-
MSKVLCSVFLGDPSATKEITQLIEQAIKRRFRLESPWSKFKQWLGTATPATDESYDRLKSEILLALKASKGSESLAATLIG